MLVNGKMNVKVEIEASEAMEVIKEHFGIIKNDSQTTLKILSPDHEANRCKKKAVYEIYDNSWYGSYSHNYHLVTSDEEKVALYEAFLMIEEAVRKHKKLFQKG